MGRSFPEIKTPWILGLPAASSSVHPKIRTE
jgi:hypothetical protein